MLDAVAMVAMPGVLVPALERVVMMAAQIRPDDPSNILSCSALEADHWPQSARVNDEAAENISFMSVTLNTSHLEMSPLNDVAWSNMLLMSTTLDTSH